MKDNKDEINKSIDSLLDSVLDGLKIKQDENRFSEDEVFIAKLYCEVFENIVEGGIKYVEHNKSKSSKKNMMIEYLTNLIINCLRIDFKNKLNIDVEQKVIAHEILEHSIKGALVVMIEENIFDFHKFFNKNLMRTFMLAFKEHLKGVIHKNINEKPCVRSKVAGHEHIDLLTTILIPLSDHFSEFFKCVQTNDDSYHKAMYEKTIITCFENFLGSIFLEDEDYDSDKTKFNISFYKGNKLVKCITTIDKEV